MNTHFAVEKTLGKLAKWLRILGFDTIYESDFLDLTKGDRILLTRTKNILNDHNSDKLLFIKSDKAFEQIREVIITLGIVEEDIRPFTRCIRCNTKLTRIAKDCLRSAIPDYVWENQNSFNTCNKCEKIYWQGSHTKRSRELIKKLFQS